MTLEEIIADLERFSKLSRIRHIKDKLEQYKQEQDANTIILSPDPEAEWILLENAEVSYGFQKCCDAFMEELKTQQTFEPFEHPKGTGVFIGISPTSPGGWEIHYCPYCGVKINLQYELPT